MDSSSVAREALVLVRKRLKEVGFSAKRTVFFRKVDGGNIVVLSIQRSTKSSRIELKMTINYGVYSTRIGTKLETDPSSALDLSKAHWRKRLTEDGNEKWLCVKSTDSPDESGSLLVRALQSVLPELVEHSTDEALRNQWLSGISPGIGGMQRLLYLAILVNEIGPREKLDSVVRELRTSVAGKIHEGLVERQLTIAGIRVQG